MKIKYNGAIKASSDGNEDIVMYWDGQKVYEGPADSDMTREIAWFLDDPEKLQEIVDYCNSFGDPVIEDTSDLMDVAATFVEMVGYELREAESIDDDVYVSDEAGHFEIFEKSKEVTGAKKSVKCSTNGNVPYDLVSMLVALRDYADVSDAYVSDEHGKLVDIADSLYNVGEEVIETMKPEFKKVYEKYGKDYFDTVLVDVSALDSQLTRNNVNDLIADYEDRANAFIGVEGACGSKKSVKAAEQDGNCDKSFKMQGTTYCIEMINDGGSYVAKWWDSSDNGLGYNNKGWVALNNDFGRNTGKFNSDNIESLLGIISEFDRKPSKPVQDRIKREVAKLINFDTINSSCGRKSIKSSDDGLTTDELVDKMNNNYRDKRRGNMKIRSSQKNARANINSIKAATENGAKILVRSNAFVNIMEDDYEQGATGSYINQWDFDVRGEYDSAQALVDAIEKNSYVFSNNLQDYYVLDGALQTSATVDNDNEIPSDSQIEAWRRGEETLYIADMYLSLEIGAVHDMTGDEAESFGFSLG